MERKRHKVNYLSGFNKKRVVSQYTAKYVTLLSSSPQPFWDHAAGCASSWLFLLTGPGGSLLTSGAGRRKQTRGPKDRRLHDPQGVARTPAGGPEMPQAQRRGISSSPLLPPLAKKKVTSPNRDVTRH